MTDSRYVFNMLLTIYSFPVKRGRLITESEFSTVKSLIRVQIGEIIDKWRERVWIAVPVYRFCFESSTEVLVPREWFSNGLA